MSDLQMVSSIRRDDHLRRRLFAQTIGNLNPQLELTHGKLYSSQISLAARRNNLSVLSSVTSGRETIKRAWELVKEAKNNVIFDPNHRDAVLIVGNSGTGKSTLVRFIASDMSTMSSIEHPKFSGNFVIIDEDEKISKPDEQSTSKTLYPELVMNKAQDVAYYDLPGFKDSRGAAIDLAGAYMTKMVFKNLTNIKVHITVEWETAIGANGRGVPFIEAIERVGEFIREAEKFKDGFSMVATKVPKVTREDDDGNDIIVPDDILIKSIGDFIVNGILPEVERKSVSETNEKEKKIQENALVIFTALSKLTDGNYSRIGLFRKPQKEGPLDKSVLMQKSRSGIINAIEKETFYKAISTDDFGMSVSDKTKLEMKEIASELNANILKNMKEIDASIKVDVGNRMRASGDWADLIASLTQLLQYVTKNAEKLKELEKLTIDFVNAMQFDFTDFGIDISSLKYQALKDDVSYLGFLEGMLEEIVVTVPQTAFDDSVTLINQAVAWYKIVFQILEILSDYSIQEDTTKYNVADLNDWGAAGRPQGLRVSAEKFAQFAKLLKIDTLAINGFNLNEERMNELNSVLKLTLATNADITMKPGGILLARGPFIHLSKVLEVYKGKETDVKFVNVHAFCATYIDTPSFTAPGCHMIVVAPKWHVIGSPIINLDGESGEGFSSSAEHGKGENPGENGHPGHPGHPAGHFLGIAEDAINAKQLTISANGGKGGDGQEGGKGGDGSTGYDARMPSDNLARQPNGACELLWHHTTEYFFYLLHEDIFRIFATEGTSGKDGGDGGIGGHGASGGSVKLFLILADTANAPKVQSSEGSSGNNGEGGDGGNGGKNGNEIKAYHWYTSYRKPVNGEWQLRETINKGYANRGSHGKKGGNDAGRESAIPQVSVSDIVNPFLIDFKGHSLEMAAKTPVLRQSLERMLRKINDTSDISKLYDTSAFLYETNSLESQFYSINCRINLAPYYNALLNRVRQYADEQKNATKQVDKLALGTVYSSCLSKLCSLQLHYNAQTFIIDLGPFIDLTLRKVDKIKDMDRRVAIKDFQQSYNQEIKVKTDEANQLIDSKVNPAIDKSMRKMDDILENLVEETLKKLKDTETAVGKLQESQAQMQKNVLIRGILHVLGLGGVIASCLGPIGVAVGAVVTGGSTIAESFVVDPDVSPVDAILLPDGVETTLKGLGDLVVSIRDKKIERLENQLASSTKAIATRPAEEKEDYKDLDAKVKELQKKLDNEKAEKVVEDDEASIGAQTQRIDAMEKDLKETITKKEEALIGEIAAGKETKRKILSGVNKIGNNVKLISATLDTYNKFKNDQKKLDAISDALHQADENINALQDYERSIYATLFPTVKKMRDNITKVKASLNGKSQVALDVTQWEVKSALNLIKSVLSTATKGYDAQSDLVACFDQLSETFSLLIHIYDRLENYHDQQALGDYIANIGAAGDYDNILKGTMYEDGVRKLDMTIQSNLVLLEFENAMHAFKQWVFPFARPYLEAISLPNSLKPVQDETSLKEMVVKAIEQLNGIRDHITRYWATISAYKKFFFTARFYSNEKLGGPFYMWKNEDFKREIQALFKGDQITLLADVRQSQQFVTYRRAIKFSKIYLRFLLDNVSANQKAKFEELMEYFVVNMVNTGVSYYEFQEQIYVISGEPITLSYSFKRDSYGVPDIASSSRDSILKGDLLLSPYGFWKIQLSADKKEAFQLITEFVNDVSLELAGTGSYIYDPEEELAALDLRPQDYYNVAGKLKDWSTVVAMK